MDEEDEEFIKLPKIDQKDEEEVLAEDEGDDEGVGVGEGEEGKEKVAGGLENRDEEEDSSGDEEEQKVKKKKESKMIEILELLTRAVTTGKRDRGLQSHAISDLQIGWLRNLQPFNPSRDNLAAWCSMVRELLPPETAHVDALRVVESRLPRNLADMLKLCVNQLKVTNKLTWDTCINLFVTRVTGRLGKMSQEKRMQRIRQREGEGIREFAVRAMTELQDITGRSPHDKEWRRIIMTGAREATLLEMDKVEATTGETDLWKLIEVGEIHERQNSAVYSLPDGGSPRGPLSPGQRPDAQKADALVLDIECEWCSKRGHREVDCSRQNPMCGECGAEHVTRRHDEVMKREEKMREPPVQIQVATPQTTDGRDMRQGDSRDSSGGQRGRGSWRGMRGRGSWRGGDRGRGSWRGRQYPSSSNRTHIPADVSQRQHDHRDVRDGLLRERGEEKHCYNCKRIGHLRKRCPYIECWNCGRTGHEQWACDRPQRHQAPGSRGLGGHTQALLVDGMVTPREDHRMLLQRMQEERKAMITKLEEIGKQMQHGRSSSASHERTNEDRSRAPPGRQKRPGWEGLLDNVVSEIRKEIVRTNEDDDIHPLYPSDKRRDSGRV